MPKLVVLGNHRQLNDQATLDRKVVYEFTNKGGHSGEFVYQMGGMLSDEVRLEVVVFGDTVRFTSKGDSPILWTAKDPKVPSQTWFTCMQKDIPFVVMVGQDLSVLIPCVKTGSAEDAVAILRFEIFHATHIEVTLQIK